MKKWIGFIFLIALINGCIPSIHPIYTQDDLVDKKELEGKWMDKEDKSNFWTFTGKGNGAYTLEFIENGKKGLFEVHLVKLGSTYYLDFYPDQESKNSSDQNSLYATTLFPMHIFGKISFESTGPKIHLFDPDWLKKVINERRIRIKHEKIDGDILLTAGTKELQQFILKYQHETKAYSTVVDLVSL